MAATTEKGPRPYGRGTSSVVSFVVAIVAMNRVDVVDLELFSVLLSAEHFCGKNFTTVPFPNDSCFRFAANSRSSFSSTSVIPLQYL